MTVPTRGLGALALAACLWAAPAAAQAPADSVLRRHQRTMDSLLAVVRALQLRLDSLARRGADSTGGDDLAALRAAAAAAAGPDSTAPATAASGGRSQNLLNPEISATGDVRGTLVRPGPQTASFDPHEFEISLQSALDPFSATKIFLGLRNGEIDVEEGYVYWAGLPGHVRLDLGKFRQTIGELNRWHGHALPEGEYPLVLQRYLGEEGLAQTGVSLYVPLPVATQLGALAVRVTWRPPAEAQRREVTLRGELYALQRTVDGDPVLRHGAYAALQARLGRRWIGGVRGDWVETTDRTSVRPSEWAVTPTLTFWQSEFVFLRLQWTHHRDLLGETSDRFGFQAVWAMGPHKHELF